MSFRNPDRLKKKKNKAKKFPRKAKATTETNVAVKSDRKS